MLPKTVSVIFFIGMTGLNMTLISLGLEFKLWSMVLMVLTLVVKASSSYHPGLIMLTVALFDNTSMLLAVMTLMIMGMIYISMSELKETKALMMSLTSVPLLVYYSDNLLDFYISFEISVIPIFMVVVMSGLYPERLIASVAMLFYTLSCSLPFLLLIMFMKYSSFGLSVSTQWSIKGGAGPLMTLILLAPLLVKLPMYGVHNWLPKAHVEAPVQGSMVLAAILLKLGGVGLVRVGAWMSMSGAILSLIAMMAMFGSAVTSAVCMRVLDIKVIIAYSSVAHMGMALYSFATMSHAGLNLLLMVMITHAFSSSVMFFSANIIYLSYHSRSLLVVKGLLSMSPLSGAIWALSIIMSMGAPPFFNLFSEVMAFQIMVSTSGFFSSMVFLVMMSTCVYSVFMYASTSQSSGSWPLSQQTNSSVLSLIISTSHIYAALVGNLMIFLIMG